VVGVATAYAICTMLLILTGYAIPFKFIELPVLDFTVTLWPTLRASLVMAGSVAVIEGILVGLRVAQPLIVLGITVPMGALVYGGFMFVK